MGGRTVLRNCIFLVWFVIVIQSLAILQNILEIFCFGNYKKISSQDSENLNNIAVTPQQNRVEERSTPILSSSSENLNNIALTPQQNRVEARSTPIISTSSSENLNNIAVTPEQNRVEEKSSPILS